MKKISNILKYTFSLSALTILLASCSSGSIAKVMQASGKPGEVMLVMDNQYIETHQAYTLLDVLEQPAPALPQEERLLQVTSRIPSTAFDGMMRQTRNILFVNIDSTRFSKSTLKYSYDEWAEGQIVVTLNTPHLDSLRNFAKTNEEILTNLFIRHELYRFAKGRAEAYSTYAEKLVDSVFKHKISLPADVRSSKVAQNFLWLSNAQMRGRHDLLVYTFPYKNSKDLSIDRLIDVRDSVLKANIQGEFEGTYPSTVETGFVYRKVILPNQEPRAELRGLWQMQGGAMMGGPFVLQAYHNKKDNLIYVFDTFVYKPNEDKLHLIRNMEAALYSARPSELATFNPKSILTAAYTKSF